MAERFIQRHVRLIATDHFAQRLIDTNLNLTHSFIEHNNWNRVLFDLAQMPSSHTSLFEIRFNLAQKRKIEIKLVYLYIDLVYDVLSLFFNNFINRKINCIPAELKLTF